MSKKYYNQNYKNSNSSYSNNASTSNMKNKKTGGVSPIWEKSDNENDNSKIYNSFFMNTKHIDKNQNFDVKESSSESISSNSDYDSYSSASRSSRSKKSKDSSGINKNNNNLGKNSIPMTHNPDFYLKKKKYRENEKVDDDIEHNFEENQIDESIGPIPIKVDDIDIKNDNRKFYAGTDLLPREAQVFSQYVQSGQRIPRRGEVGLTSDDIERYESLGYVMSGSRHKKMNAARIKKEAQIYTAEEKRALAIFNREEQQRRELNIINEMKVIWKTQQKEDN